MPKRIKIRNKYIGENDPVFIIAEIGSNHNQDFSLAKKLIDVSAKAGVDAVKFQLFSADKLYPKTDKLYQIFKNIELNIDWIGKLKTYANSRNLIFFASAFDDKSIEILNNNQIPLYKWASSETTNLYNLRKAASYGKPIIISTGMCDMADVYEALQVCYSVGNDNIVLLHCTSLYPTRADQVNINAMVSLINMFQVCAGLSDHTLSSTAAIAAVANGAKVIEKHITLDRKMKGPDHFYAIEPNELIKFVEAIRETEECMGSDKIEIHPDVVKIARREGIYAKSEINKGEVIKPEMLEVKRPALGVKSRYIRAIIGARAKRKISMNKPITWRDLC